MRKNCTPKICSFGGDISYAEELHTKICSFGGGNSNVEELHIEFCSLGGDIFDAELHTIFGP